MLSKNNQQKTLISDINKKIDKMRFLDKENYNQISKQVDGYRKEMFRQKYRMPYRKFKCVVAVTSLLVGYNIYALREVGYLSHFRGLQNGIELKKAAFLFQATEDKLNLTIDKRNKMLENLAMEQANEKTRKRMLTPFKTTDKFHRYQVRDVVSTGGVVNDPMPASAQMLQRLAPATNNYSI